jgi:Luciferase-like monooxygenase/CoA binding domain
VNPCGSEFFGEYVFRSLTEINAPEDMVEVFCPAKVARQAMTMGAKVLWLQLRIVSEWARRITETARLTVVMDRCIGATHALPGIRTRLRYTKKRQHDRPEPDRVVSFMRRTTIMEIGIHTFGELVSDPHTHHKISAHKRLKQVIQMAILADEVGLDIFGVGEHHRLDIAISAPSVVLAAVAQATKRIRLTSTATVLSTADPVRVFEEFATLDLLSDGRAEIIAGRGAFVESFKLFGYDLQDYDDLFAEKIDLLTRLNAAERISWQDLFRPALHAAQIAPRPL